MANHQQSWNQCRFKLNSVMVEVFLRSQLRLDAIKRLLLGWVNVSRQVNRLII